ncbi:MAG: ABC transporter permease [Dehalococcoidia bacterium]|jgi:predicted permease|nr:ABC transporter permease [Dehalococcoidia bacterium]
MPWPSRLSRLFKNLLRRDHVERELSDEVESYLGMLVDEKTAAGLSPEEARRAARLELGGVDQVKELSREVRAGALIEQAWQDVRIALRSMRRTPGFTAVALLTLALCIGANTTIFSVIHGVLLRPLPFPEGNRLVTLFNIYPAVASSADGENSPPDYFDRRAETDVFESLALFNFQSYTIGDDGSPQRVVGARTTASLFDVLRTQPTLGRPFTEADAEPGNERLAILSHGLWQEMFAGSPGAIGRPITIDGVDHDIVGVMPVGFTVLAEEVAILRPWAFNEQERSDGARHGNYAKMIGRLQPGVSTALAQERIDALNARLLEQFPDFRPLVERLNYSTVVIGIQDQLVRFVRPTLYVLQASVLLVLLIGCVNIANLLLTRASGRTQELAIRFALGAARWRVMRQLLTESLVLAIIGGAAGLAIGAAGLELFTRLELPGLPPNTSLAIDGSVVAFTAAIATLTGLVFGVIPALHLSRGDLERLLRQGGRSGSAGGSAKTRGVLVVAQVSLAFVLLIGAGLLVVSFGRVLNVDPGFRPAQVLTAQVSLPLTRYNTPAAQAFNRRAQEAIEALPGVSAVGLTTLLPFSDDGNKSVVVPEGYPFGPDEGLPLPHNVWIGGDYFASMGIPVLAGREFEARDDLEAPFVAIVDEDFAAKYWPGENPIGKRLHFGAGDGNPWQTVVGLVGSVKVEDLAENDDRGSVYFSMTQTEVGFRWSHINEMTAVIRTDGSAASLGNTVRATILGLDPQLPIYDVQVMETRLAESLGQRRTPMALLLFFAGVALALSALGIYGVLAFAVSQRTKEIGIRMALGAEPARIVRQILWQGGALVGTGLLVGTAGALGLTQLISSLLYAVEPTDPMVFTAVAAMLTFVGLTACLVPSRRATRIDPAAALRDE